MSSDKALRRKWTFRTGEQQVVFVKNRNERSAHVLMKAFLWALYLPQFPDLSVEIKIGDRYKPDVVQLNDRGEPLFWGEAGQVGVRKLESLFKRFRTTHFAIGKWNTSLHPHIDIVRRALPASSRSAPVDLIAFPADSEARFIDERGHIAIKHADLNWVRIPGGVASEMAGGA